MRDGTRDVLIIVGGLGAITLALWGTSKLLPARTTSAPIQPGESIVTLPSPLVAEYATIVQFDAAGIKIAEIGKPTFVAVSKVTVVPPAPVRPGLVPSPPAQVRAGVWSASLVLLGMDGSRGIFRYDGSLPDLTGMGLRKGHLFYASGTH